MLSKIFNITKQHWPIPFAFLITLLLSNTLWRLGGIGDLLWLVIMGAGIAFDFLVVQKEQQESEQYIQQAQQTVIQAQKQEIQQQPIKQEIHREPIYQTPKQQENKQQPEVPGPPPRDLQEIWDEIDSMIGLVPVKQRIKEIVDNIKANYIRQQRGIDVKGQTLHMAFLGNPGTGKTEVARKVGELLCAIGALPGSAFVQVGKSDLVGQYVGQTALKVRAVVEKVLAQGGGVLFIDEAYSLNNLPGNASSFGQEAVEEIMQYMENARDKLCVILAGYEGEMMHFINKTNPGLKSRIPYYINFPDYTPDELIEILKLHAGRQGYQITNDALEKIKTHLPKVNMQTEGNGRYIRNILEKAITKQAPRVLDQEDPTILIADDFVL